MRFYFLPHSALTVDYQSAILSIEIEEGNKMARNRLKELAKDLVFVNDSLEKESVNELDITELKAHQNQIMDEIIKGGYSADLLVQYMKEYREVPVGEYNNWINS